MSPLDRRRLLAVVAAFAILFAGGAGVWAFLVFPYACWCFYDGIL